MLILVHLETLLMLMQDRSIVCVEHTIGSVMLWMHSMVLLGDKFQVEARFGPFGDIANPNAR